MAYWAEGDSGGSQSYEAAISSMWLMYRVGIFITKLLNDALDSVVVLCNHVLADRALEPHKSVSLVNGGQEAQTDR